MASLTAASPLPDEVEQRARRQVAVAELGVRALRHRLRAALFADALDVAARTLGATAARLVESDGTQHLFGLAAADAPASASVVVHGSERALGVLSVHAEAGRSFGSEELAFLQSIAQIVAGAVERQQLDDEMRSVFEGALDAMLIADDDARYVDANPAACALLGVPREAIVGKTLADFTDVPAAGIHAAWQAFLRDRHASGTFPLRHRDGTTRIVEFRATARIRPGRHLSIMRDVTERERLDAERRRAGATLHTLLEKLPDAVAVLRPGGVVRWANDVAARLLGLSCATELIGRGVAEFVHPDERHEAVASMSRPLPVGERLELQRTVIHDDGRSVLLHIVCIGVMLDGELVRVAIYRDNTEELRAFAALQRSEANFRALLDGAPDGISITDENDRIVYANAAAARILGYDDAASILRLEAHEIVHPDDYPTQQEPAGKRGISDLELRVRTATGGTTQIEVRTLPLSFDGRPARLSIFRDVSERKQLQLRLMQADRMVAVGMLAAGVGHEINNPLAWVSANLTLLDESVRALDGVAPRATLDEMQQMIADATTGSVRIRDIVRDLRTFSRGDDERKEEVDVRRVLDSSVSMARNEIRHSAQLVKDYAEVPPVVGNASRLGQLFLNLLVNAAQAIPVGHATDNEIRVEVRAVDGKVRIRVADTGAGIAPELSSRIFEPFVTTKPIGVGTGLGLAICHGIVTGMGGTISVESVVGRGTTFTVMLPAAAAATPSPPAPPTTMTPTARRGRLLVVDDEPNIGTSIARGLRSEHDVVAVSSARDALALLALGERFDLILCDLMMPVMSGVELFAEVGRRFADEQSRIVFLSGGAFSPSVQTFLAEVPNLRIEKPFDLAALRALVRDRLAQP